MRRGWDIVAAAVLVGVLAACGQPVRQFGSYGAYVVEFEKESLKFGRPVVVDDLIIETSRLEPHVTADCTRGSFMTPTIRLNERNLMRANRATIKLALFHEMGHCVLNRVHTLKRRPNGFPASIMYPTNVFASVFERDRNYYLRELFTGSAAEEGRGGSFAQRTTFSAPDELHPEGHCSLMEEPSFLSDNLLN